RIPRLLQEGPDRERRLFHGPHRDRLSDGQEWPLRCAVQPAPHARSFGGRPAPIFVMIVFTPPRRASAGRPSPSRGGWICCSLVLMAAALLTRVQPTRAQTPPAPVPPAAASASGVPSFWDPRRRPEKPDTSRVNLIRFMSEVDYPPFNYAGPDGNPT